jgi:hypothetical protein
VWVDAACFVPSSAARSSGDQASTQSWVSGSAASHGCSGDASVLASSAISSRTVLRKGPRVAASVRSHVATLEAPACRGTMTT